MKKTFPWQILIDWFDKNGKHDFPWREYSGTLKVESRKFESGSVHSGDITLYFTLYTLPYKVWLAEILLQQTQADRVVPFYTRILDRYPTVHDLARADYDEFFPYYQGLGYYSRARNLLKTAKIVSEEYGGVFPRDKSKLRKLPGIGEYTARAILAFGYTEPLLAWDTNLETIFSRYYKGAKNIKLTLEEKDEIEEDFREFLIGFQAMNSGGLGRGTVGVGGKEVIGGAERTHPKGISNATESQRGSFSLPNSFGTFSTKSTSEIVSEKINITRDINNALMDWARLMEPKNSSLLDLEKYIFTESEFYITNGANEIIEKKISTYFPIPDASIIVTLHQDHKIYYSLSNELYSPFILPPSEDQDTRKYVQEYFRRIYGLELSVRPVHRKWITEDGKPFIAVNAQVQAGKNNFFEWNKKREKLSNEG